MLLPRCRTTEQKGKVGVCFTADEVQEPSKPWDAWSTFNDQGTSLRTAPHACAAGDRVR